MYRALLCFLFLPVLRAEVVDRIAITVEHQVITELQIDEELCVTAFLNHAPVVRDLARRRAAADRIVAQLLVAREMQLSHYPAPANSDVERYLAQVRAGFSNNAAYEESLRAHQITEPELTQHLSGQLASLSFIEIRFRPNLDVPDSEVEAFYRSKLSTWKTDHPDIAPPTFAAARDGILSTLTEQHTDQILDTWLEEARKQVSIVYLDKALQ